MLAAIGCASLRTPVRRPLGGISGTVLDASTGEPVGGALIGVRDGQSAMSNGRGEFALAPLVDGKYDVTVEHAGYLPASAEKIAVERGYYTTLAVKLIRGPDFGAPAPPGSSIVPPVFVSRPAVTYPDLTPQLQGKMLVRCVLTIQGEVTDCLPDQDVPELAPVIRQLEQRRYRPALRDGVPIQVWYVFTLRFPGY